MTNEGYIKFHCQWEKKDCIKPEDIIDLNRYRRRLLVPGLIGAYRISYDGNAEQKPEHENIISESKSPPIGFGNISKRWGLSEFIITGSATGHIRELTSENYSLATGWDIKNNIVHCKGLTPASSEALSHAAVYEALPEVNSVIHAHSLLLWEKLINKANTSPESAEYGTPEIAGAIKQILIKGQGEYREHDVNSQIIVMGGHKEGVITYGNSLEEAVNILFYYLCIK